MRRFPAPWTVEEIPGGYKVVDANKVPLAYVYANTSLDAGVNAYDKLSWQEALTVANGLSRYPDLVTKVRGLSGGAASGAAGQSDPEA